MGMNNAKMGRSFGPSGQLIPLCKTIITKVKTTIGADIYRAKESEHHLQNIESKRQQETRLVRHSHKAYKVKGCSLIEWPRTETHCTGEKKKGEYCPFGENLSYKEASQLNLIWGDKYDSEFLII